MIKLVTDLTKKTVAATKADDEFKQMVMQELMGILESRPEDAPQDLVRYLEFLIQVIGGTSTEKLKKRQSPMFLQIFNQEISGAYAPEMEKFFKELAQKIFSVKKEKNADEIKEYKVKLDEMKKDLPDSEDKNIKSFLNLLYKFLEDKDISNSINSLHPQLKEILADVIK